MSFDLDRLYNLLPAIYRIHDLEQAEHSDRSLEALSDRPLSDRPLGALLSTIADQVAVLEEDLAQLYDDQFIETCQEWVIPYIGDLVGYRSAYDVLQQSLRVEVADTINYRRRKGTATLLEQLARDVTGWYVHVVEFFKLLAMTQHVLSPRLQSRVVDLRQQESLNCLNTPFDTLSHTADVRSIATQRGRYNIQNVGIFVWRLHPYSLTNSPAAKVDNYRYLFSPLGNNIQLFSRPHIADNVTQLTGPQGVAMPISRNMLARYLQDYYGEGKSLLLTVDGKEIQVNSHVPGTGSPLQHISHLIEVADLSDVKDADGNVVAWTNMPRSKIAIDPLLGRISFPRGKGKRAPKNVQVSFHYGFSTEMGGGEYSRLDSFTRLDPVTTQLLPVEQVSPITSPPERVPHQQIQQALDALTGSGIVEITDSGRYSASPAIHVSTNQLVELRAAEGRRPLLLLTNDADKRNNSVTPELSISGEEGAQVVLNGLVISGGRLHVTGNLSRLTLRHCTLVPGLSIADGSAVQDKSKPAVFESESVSQKIEHISPDETIIARKEKTLVEIDRYPPTVSLIVESPAIIVELDRCIVGGLRVVDSSKVQITNSIVDATSQHGIVFAGLDEMTAGGTLHIANSTVIGLVHASQIDMASNTIFLARHKGQERAPVHVERRQDGCIRFSYLPARSRVPRRYHCQPESEQAAEWVHPHFTSLRYGDAGYCQLSRRNVDVINRGADDESEMGAFHDLYQPQRETNLRLRLHEYLRFTLEAGIFYLT